MSNAKEFAARGVKVNCVCPGFIESDMTAELNAEYMDEVPYTLTSTLHPTPYSVEQLHCQNGSWPGGFSVSDPDPRPSTPQS
jgi:NAD(P)-dependent dehydrogenase (short-subunit alcohol dehydrogenase family)